MPATLKHEAFISLAHTMIAQKAALQVAGQVAGRVAAQIKAQVRDPHEPGRARKEEYENKLDKLFQAYFARLSDKIQRNLSRIPRAAKTWEDIFDDEYFYDLEFESELILTLLAAAKDGAKLAGLLAKLDIDYNLTNTEAAAWVRRYMTPFLKDLNQTTKDNIRSAVRQFIETPGMTVKDTMDMIGLDPERSKRIAVTETTRAYAEGNLEYAAQLKKDFPDVRVTKQWYTNNDDLVCPICGALDKQEVDYDKEFEDGTNAPPAHVNCRCWLDVGTRI